MTLEKMYVDRREWDDQVFITIPYSTVFFIVAVIVSLSIWFVWEKLLKPHNEYNQVVNSDPMAVCYGCLPYQWPPEIETQGDLLFIVSDMLVWSV